MDNLEIVKEIRGDEVELTCTGRLDANRAGHLNDYIDRLVREGQYHIALDLNGIEYLSSAGIRSLINQHKNLKTVNGYFYIKTMSENVRQVLNMVGLETMLSEAPVKKAPAQSDEKAEGVHQADGFTFQVTPLSAESSSEIGLYGNPDLIKDSAFEAANARLVKSENNKFAIGLGAIGDSFDECKNRFGEYMMLGKNIAYLPADGSKKPDYMVSSGQLVASLSELYGLHFEGNFSHIIRFDYLSVNSTIGLSQLVDNIAKITALHDFALVMVAENGGLIGTSLNASPVEGRKLFSFPEIKETVNFTTEPAHAKKLTLSIGYFSAEKNKDNEKFLRPLGPESKFSGHTHTAVFPYIPLKKRDIDLNETIEFLFETSELTDILHLTNDTREIVGLGESQFVQGFCWIVPVSAINQINNK